MTTAYRQRPIEPTPNPGLRREQFSKICENGFGDGHNSHAHSMVWWKDHLYVGTTRALLCALRVHKHIGEWNLDVWPIECPDDVDGLYKLVDRRAQIWRYNPTTKDWRRVMQAPMVMGTEGEEVPRDIGYRCMTVFQGESDVEPVLYVVTTAPGRGPGALILRSEDGENFSPVSDYGIMGLPITSIRFAVPFKGKLFTSPNATRGSRHNTSDFPIVYESRDPAKRQWQAASLSGFGIRRMKRYSWFVRLGIGSMLGHSTALVSRFGVLIVSESLLISGLRLLTKVPIVARSTKLQPVCSSSMTRCMWVRPFKTEAMTLAIALALLLLN
jgi:hypothetical protein